MLKICLIFWKSEPQYAYKRYAYKKHVFYDSVQKLNEILRAVLMAFLPHRLIDKPYCMRHSLRVPNIDLMEEYFYRDALNPLIHPLFSR